MKFVKYLPEFGIEPIVITVDRNQATYPILDESLLKEVDEEIVKLQTDLISERDFQKLQNGFESQFVNRNASIEGIAENLATYYLLHGDVNLINTEIDMYRNITRENIRDIAKKYLNPNQRLLLDYLPAKDKAQN